MAISVSCFPTLVLDHGVSYSNRKPVHILMEFQIPSKQVSLPVASHVILGCQKDSQRFGCFYVWSSWGKKRANSMVLIRTYTSHFEGLTHPPTTSPGTLALAASKISNLDSRLVWRNLFEEDSRSRATPMWSLMSVMSWSGKCTSCTCRPSVNVNQFSWHSLSSCSLSSLQTSFQAAMLCFPFATRHNPSLAYNAFPARASLDNMTKPLNEGIRRWRYNEDRWNMNTMYFLFFVRKPGPVK